MKKVVSAYYCCVKCVKMLKTRQDINHKRKDKVTVFVHRRVYICLFIELKLKYY